MSNLVKIITIYDHEKAARGYSTEFYIHRETLPRGLTPYPFVSHFLRKGISMFCTPPSIEKTFPLYILLKTGPYYEKIWCSHKVRLFEISQCIKYCPLPPFEKTGSAWSAQFRQFLGSRVEIASIKVQHFVCEEYPKFNPVFRFKHFVIWFSFSCKVSCSGITAYSCTL